MVISDHSNSDLYFRKVGHGPHLSFLHGFCEHSGVWNRVADILRDEFTCILFDLPGYGKSAKLPIQTLDKQAAQIAATLDALQIGPCTLFGHSMGGYIALELLRSHTEVLNGLGLIHSVAMPDREEAVARRMKANEFAERNPVAEFLRPFSKRLVAPHHYEEMREDLWDLVKDTSSQSVIQSNEAMMQRADNTSSIQNSKVPLLFLCGEQDEFFSPEVVLGEAALSPFAMIEKLADCGHLAMYEQPEKCAEIIRRFALLCLSE